MYADFYLLMNAFKKTVDEIQETVRRNRLRKYRVDREAHDGMVEVPRSFLLQLIVPLSHDVAELNSSAFFELLDWCNESEQPSVRLPAESIGRWIDRFKDTPYLSYDDFELGCRCVHLIRFEKTYLGCATCERFVLWDCRGGLTEEYLEAAEQSEGPLDYGPSETSTEYHGSQLAHDCATHKEELTRPLGTDPTASRKVRLVSPETAVEFIPTHFAQRVRRPQDDPVLECCGPGVCISEVKKNEP